MEVVGVDMVTLRVNNQRFLPYIQDMSGALKIIFCDTCLRHIPESDWTSHENGNMHKTRNMASIHITNLKQRFSRHDLFGYFSQFGAVELVCMHPQNNSANVMFENMESSSRAIQNCSQLINNHRIYVSKLKPGLSREPTDRSKEGLLQQLETLNEVDAQMLWLMQESSLSEIRNNEIQSTLRTLESAMQVVLPEVRLKPFGSAVNGLGTPNCDLDVVFELSDIQHKFNPQTCRHPMPETRGTGTKMLVADGCIQVESLMSLPKEKLCRLVMNVLHVSPAGCCAYHPIPNHPRIPMLKFHSMYDNLDVDMSFSSGLSLKNTRLIQVLLELDPRVRVLMYSVRLWSKHTGFSSGQNRVTSYALFLMVYFYLQNTTPRLLPSVQQLSELAVKLGCSSPPIDGWDCSFFDDVSMINSSLMTDDKNTETAPQLLAGFFKFYAELDLLTTVLCPRTGNVYSVMEFRKLVNADPKLANFKFKYLFLQDPFELNHNTLHHLNSKMAFLFSLSFMQAHSTIEKAGTAWKLHSVIPEREMIHDEISLPGTDELATVLQFHITELPESFPHCETREEAEDRWHRWIVDSLVQLLTIWGMKVEVGKLAEPEPQPEVVVVAEKRPSDESESDSKRQKTSSSKKVECTIFDTPVDDDGNLPESEEVAEANASSEGGMSKRSKKKKENRKPKSELVGAKKVLKHGTCIRCETSHRLWHGRFSVMMELGRGGNGQAKDAEKIKDDQISTEASDKMETEKKGDEKSVEAGEKQAVTETKNDDTKSAIITDQTKPEVTKSQTKPEEAAEVEMVEKEPLSPIELEEKVTALLSERDKSLLECFSDPLQFDVCLRRFGYGWRTEIDITVQSELTSLMIAEFRTFMSTYGTRSLKYMLNLITPVRQAI